MKPERSLVWIGVLPSCAANASARRDGLLAGVEADDDLDELHHRHRREEVQAQHAVAASSHAASAAIGIDDVFDASMAVVAQQPVEALERVDLGLLVLDDRLDHDVARRERVEVGRPLDALQRAVASSSSACRPSTARVDRLLDALLGPVQRALLRLAQHDAQARRAPRTPRCRCP